VTKTKFFRATLSAIGAVGLSSALAFALPSDRFEGAPTIDEAKPTMAVYVWSVRDAEYIRFHSNKADQQFTGRICSPGRIEVQERYKLEPDDKLHTRRKGTCVAFELRTGAGADGFGFHSRGGDITFDIKLNGAAMSVKRIFVGASGVHPRRVPFTKKR